LSDNTNSNSSATCSTPPNPTKRHRPSTTSTSTTATSTLPTTAIHTHNVPWTRDEKKRLNDLLVQYPEEPVAARRYAKIAAALGTRTATQVFTRVNKLIASKRAADLSDGEGTGGSGTTGTAPSTTHDTPEYLEYVKLKQALEQELNSAGTAMVHSGIACSRCHARPIVGVRYRCVECAVDLCDVCFVPGVGQGGHHNHRVQTVSSSASASGASVVGDVQMAEFDYLNPKQTG
jgi:hypothetical protein